MSREIICFHNLGEKNGYLSNWYMSEFVMDEITFSSMEKYMMYQKAKTFQDQENLENILQSDDVAQIKEYGRRVKNYDDTVWNGIRQIIVYNGLLEKFSQNEELGKQLKATKESLLAECAVGDKIWGIGLSMHDPDRMDVAKWKGKNLLGFSLMKVREVL